MQSKRSKAAKSWESRREQTMSTMAKLDVNEDWFESSLGTLLQKADVRRKAELV